MANDKEIIEIFSKLSEPFEDKDLDWRVQQGGITKAGKPWATILCYVDARAVMDRLDSALGPHNWQDEYYHKAGGVECRLHYRIAGEWLYKTDGSPETAVEAFKGGYSKALVRTAVKLGIGRYLYNLGTNFAIFGDKKPGSKMYKDKETGKVFWWMPPSLGYKRKNEQR